MPLVFPKSKRQQLADRESKISAMIALSHLNSATVFETKHGTQGSVIEVQGCPFEVMDHADINWHQRLLANFLVSLSDEFAVYITTHRHRQTQYPTGDFPAGFADDFNRAYQQLCAQQSLYINSYYITIMIKGATHKVGKTIHWMQRLSHRSRKMELVNFREQQRKKLHQAVLNALQLLKAFTPRLLGNVSTSQSVRSEILSFFGILINGREQPFSPPQQDLAIFLPTRRLSFGHNTLEWQGNSPDDRQLAAIMSIKNYGGQSNSTMLDSLLTVDFETITTHAFARQDQTASLEQMHTQNKHLEDANDAAISQQDALIDAMDLLASGELTFGMHHHTILVLASTQHELEAHIAKLTKLYRDADLVVVRETLNLESAFWAQIPGNFTYMRRQALISSDNFTDMCPLHNYHHGYINKNHLGSALMMVESSSRTPLYINFHERASGRANDLSKGHTTLIAPSNAGKTSFLLALDAQSKKYRSTSFFFDRDRGCEIYVRAMGGYYTRIHPSEATGFNPLALTDTANNRDFLNTWLASLLVSCQEDILSAYELKCIENVIARNYTLPHEQRNLSNITSFFPSQFSRLDHLQPWLRAPNTHQPAGRLAYLFDHDTDHLTLDNTVAGFDLTHLLDHETSQVIFSVMLYLFHRIECLMDGRLIGIYLDEGWQLLNNPYWASKMRQYLATLRKLNAYLVFATQAPSTVIASPLRAALIEGTATQIFLPNPKAETTDYCDGFKLSLREYEFIKNTAERRFLMKQGHESSIGRLNLTGLEDFLAVFSANKTTLSLLDEIRAEVGEDPTIWLPIFHQRRPH